EWKRAGVLLLSTGIVARGLARGRVVDQVDLAQGGAGDDSAHHAHPESPSKPPSALSTAAPVVTARHRSSAPITTAVALATALTRAINTTFRHIAAEHTLLHASTSATSIPRLQARLDGLATCLEEELAPLERETTDAADAIIASLLTGEARRLKSLEEAVDRAIKARRRKGWRVLRRGGWWAVEWAVVGGMWVVWGVVVVGR